MKDSDKRVIKKLLESLNDDLEKEILQQIKTKNYNKGNIETILKQIDADILKHPAIKEDIIEGTSFDEIKSMIEQIQNDIKEKVEMLSNYDKKITDELERTVNGFDINKKINIIDKMKSNSEYSYGTFGERYAIVEAEKVKLEKQRSMYKDVEKLKKDGKLDKSDGKDEILSSFDDVQKSFREWKDAKKKLDKIHSFDFNATIKELNSKLDDEDYVKSDEFKTKIRELKEMISLSKDKDLDDIKKNDTYTNNSKDYKYDISKVRGFVADLSNIDFSKLDEIENYEDKVEGLNTKFKKDVENSKAFLFNPDEKKRLMDALDGKGYNIVNDVINAYIRPKQNEIKEFMPDGKNIDDINKRYVEVVDLFYKMEAVKKQGYKGNNMKTPDEEFSEKSKILDLSKYGVDSFDKIEVLSESGNPEEVDFTKVDDTNKADVIDALYKRYIDGENAQGQTVEWLEKRNEIRNKLIEQAQERNGNLPMPKEGFFARLWSRITKRPTKRDVAIETLIKNEFAHIIEDRKNKINAEKADYTVEYNKNKQFDTSFKEEETTFQKYQREAVMDGKTKPKEINKHANERMLDEER